MVYCELYRWKREFLDFLWWGKRKSELINILGKKNAIQA